MKALLIFSGLFFIINAAFCQSKGITPMHKIFQQLADSTIIIEYPTDSYDPPSYKIISITNDTVNTFTYYPLDTTYIKFVKQPTGMPKALGLVLSVHKTSFNTMPANINIFFDIHKLKADTAKKIWQDISKFKPWGLVDDKSYPVCPPDSSYAIVMDAGYSIMHLITKKEIKTLVYSAPNYYESQCPGNANRQGVIAIEKLFYQKIPYK